MNPIIRKFSLQLGLILALIQICITLYLYNYGSFIDITFGFLIIILNILFGVATILLVKKKQANSITLRECFSGYFITILISTLLSTLFYVVLFNTVATTSKKEVIKKELFNFQQKNMKDNNFSEADIKKNIELSRDSNPFSIGVAMQSAIKYLILYSILGLLFSFILKNKSSFQEIPN